MKTGERCRFEFAFVSPYTTRPGYKHSFEGAVIEARRIARAVLGHGHGPQTHPVYVVDRSNGHTWIVGADDNAPTPLD